MNNRETIFVTRKAEDEPTETERKGGSSAPCAQGQNDGKLNWKLWVASPHYGGDGEGNRYHPRTAY